MNQQPDPIANDRPPIADLVCADIQERKRHGIKTYTVPLQAFNNRNCIRDAYEEMLDASAYLKQTLEEMREGAYAQLGLQSLVEYVHGAMKDVGWWDEFFVSDPKVRNYIIATKLMLIVSELSEAMEGARKGLQDDKLPHRKMLEVELADAIIRIADLAGALNLDLAGAVMEKMEYNRKREDHKREHREAEGGKKY